MHFLRFRNHTRTLKCSYRKQFLRKAVAMINVVLLQGTSCVKLGVLSAMHFKAETWKLITLTTIKNCFEKCGLYQLSVYSNDDDVLNLKKMEITGIVCNLIDCSWSTT